MKIKPFLFTLLMLAGAMSASGAMTDEQVIQYVKAQMAQGKSEQQIGRELLAKGVTPEQVKRLKAKYDAGTLDTGDQPVTATEGRGRVHTTTGETSAALDDIVQNPDAQKDTENASASEIFGHRVFNSRNLTFEPNENAATPQDYRLGPGDEVVIDIWGVSEDHLRRTISPEGNIMIAQLGPLYLNGMTIEQANNHIRSAFSSKYSGVDNEATDIAVTLGQMRTIQVNIMGEVTTPGTYRLSPFSTVFHALYNAGGINKIGSMRNIEVRRNGRKVAEVDIYDFLFNGTQKGNIRLQEGDVIMVPPYEELVNITGNVKRPMFYELKPNETLEQAIEYAGGFSGDAYTDMVRVARQSGREKELYNVANAELADYRLADGDIVTVGTILDRYSNRVELRGAAMRPGLFSLGSGISTIRDLIRNADGLEEDAYTDRAMLYREAPDLTLVAEAVDLGAILNGTAPDITLKRNDVLVISSVREIFDKGGFTIRGSVSRPGTYPYAENTSIEDLILTAGGLTEGASYAKVDVSRRIIDPMATTSDAQIARVYTFNLKDGLLLGDDNDFVLMPYDIVEVRRSPNYVAQQFVEIDGEVTFAGGYVIQQRNERLSQFIKRAGGLTPEAYIRGAHLMRRMTEDEKAARDETIRLAMGSSGKDSISVKKLVTSDFYSVGIDLEKALANPGSNADIVLRAGDQLYIPEEISTIKVSGDVMVPSTLTFTPGLKVKDYIDQAGGYGDRANKKKAFIVYMNGMAARVKRNTKVEPGCQIIVPSKPDKQGFDWAKGMTIATSLGSLGTMSAAIANMIKN
ncbi:MAG: SLBB domain-containing protein [Bacteroides sp.]|nr:SLBB domain-containing protein [Bacteroides sp.]